MTFRSPLLRAFRPSAQRRPTVFIGNDKTWPAEPLNVLNRAQRRPTVFIGNDRVIDAEELPDRRRSTKADGVHRQ